MRGVWSGAVAGLSGMVEELWFALLTVYTLPDEWARAHGALGFLLGLALSPALTLFRVLHSLLILIDRLATGVSNGCCGRDDVYTFDPLLKSHLHEQESTRLAIAHDREHMSEARERALFRAMNLALAARRIFARARPYVRTKVYGSGLGLGLLGVRVGVRVRAPLGLTRHSPAQ